MLTFSQASNRYSPKELWTKVSPYATPPSAAALSIIPVFYGFIAKSASQVGSPWPRMTIQETLRKGCQAAPTIGVIVGTQMTAQNFVEMCLANFTNDKKNSSSDFKIMLVSSMIVGAISAPALAVFNGQTMGRTIMQSLRGLSLKQAGAIVTRETSFLFSLRVSEPVSDFMERQLGENEAVKCGSAFVSGVIGSVIGHPADTALTVWQKGETIQSFKHAMRGSPIKAIAVGGFTVCYTKVKGFFDSFTK